MHSFEHNSVVSPPTSETRTLGGVLEELDITPFTPESVAHYKRERLAAAMEEIVQRRQLVQEVAPAYWERQMLRRLQRDEAFHNPDDDDFRVKFFEIGSARIAVYVRWEKKPLTEALDVPDYVKAKARQTGPSASRAGNCRPGRAILLPAVVGIDPEMAMHQMKLRVTDLANTF